MGDSMDDATGARFLLIESKEMSNEGFWGGKGGFGRERPGNL